VDRRRGPRRKDSSGAVPHLATVRPARGASRRIGVNPVDVGSGRIP